MTIGNPDRKHPRVQRYRASVQRELWGTTAIEVAYNYQVGDRLPMTLRMDYLPEQYWNGNNVRDVTQQNFLQTNVPNPFLLSRFSSLQTSNPALYARMAGNAFFTGTTVQLHRLLRGPYPQYERGQRLFANLPLGKQTTHGVEINFTRRFNKGFALSAAYSGNRIRNLEFLNEYDREPTLWQPNVNGRPHRVTASGLAEIPFGPGGSSRARAFLARFSAAGRSAARSNTSLDRSSRGVTSSSTAISRTSRVTTRRSSAGSTWTPGSSAIRRRCRPTSRSASSRSESMASGGRTSCR